MESAKILRELSDLTKNMDILVRELRSANKVNSQNSDSLKEVTDKIAKDETPAKDNSSQLQDSFKGFTESFIKSFEAQNKDIVKSLTKSLNTSVSEFSKNIPGQVAKIKSSGIDTIKSTGGKTIEGALDKVASKIPGLYQGGIAETDGLAIVGEKGPELVELKKGEKVRTIEEQLLEIELEDMKKKEKKTVDASINSDAKLPSLVENLISKYKSGEGALEESKIRDYIVKMAKDDPDLLTDMDYLKDELDYYKDMSSRDLFTKQDVEKLSKPIEESIVSKDSEKKSKESKNSKTVEKSISDSVQVKTQETLANKEAENKGLSSTPSADKSDAAKSETGKQKLETVANKTSPSANFDVSKDSLNAFLERNKKYLPAEEKKSTPTQNTPEPTDSPSSSSPKEATEKKPVEKKEPAKPQQAPSQITGGISSKDVKDIKGLLAGIYKAISGPLNISSDEPFRPNSNYF